MGVKDILLTPIYLGIIYSILFSIKRNKYADKEFSYFFIRGFTLKVIGAVVAGLVYQFYYKGGDTFNFYQGTTIIWDAFTHNPISAIKILFLKAGNYDTSLTNYVYQIWFFRDPKSWLVVKLGAFVGFFCFNTYLVISIVFALFSFFSSWTFYKVLIETYPKLWKPIGYVMFYIPSVVFWGSGYFKDTITLASIFLISAGFYHLVIKFRLGVKNILFLVIGGWLLYNIRSFYFLAFVATLIVWWFFRIKDKIKTPWLRKLSTPLILALSIVGFFIAILRMSTGGELSEEELMTKLLGFHMWHAHQGGSTYSLGVIDYSFGGIIKKIPASINVALFRPYLFEANSPVMVISSLESLFFLLFTLYIVLKSYVIKFPIYLLGKAEIFFGFIVGLFFAFITGFTSFNFGALVRYKIPCMPFYLLAMTLIYYLYIKKDKEENEDEKILENDYENKDKNDDLTLLTE